ncbi:MAG: hypothetical protein FWH02_00720, partial [Oscillospiraceae bacterium]|nr:hypothetical protein [Oscillospiraceae bacterium]
NRDGALAVLEFFSQPDEYINFTNEVGFYPTQPNVNHTNEFLKTMDVYMQSPSQEFGAYVPKGVGEYGGSGGSNAFLYSVIGGPFTYEQLAAAAQEDWDSARAAFAAGE